ncbi:superinfection immunity protein [Flavobacterium aquidurense]|uniref:superinfection immunity protein n=1 Tax=Flavobacterium aquidurense TaxID=362413 RepID=UPI002862F09C|nr:superinfection immunity protein [Flavobacterium aquidurense]MDR7372575.1 hypothetical protein [Flavobacterium aquidurense]
MKKNYSFTLLASLTSSLIQAQTKINLPFENRELTIEKVMAGAVVLFVYFIPTIILWNKRNSKYLFVFNLLTAWTVLCWFISFVWALQINRQHVRILAEERKIRKRDKNLKSSTT